MHFRFFVFQGFIDLGNELVREFLDLFLRHMRHVLGDRLGLLELLHLLDRLVTGIADRDAAFFSDLANDLGQLHAPLIGEPRDLNAKNLSVIDGRETEVGFQDRLFDLCNGSRIPRLDLDGPGVRRGDRRRRILQRP